MTQWKLVPVEPTSEMVQAMLHSDQAATGIDRVGHIRANVRRYQAMLSAAPSPDGEVVERVARSLAKSAFLRFQEADPGFVQLKWPGGLQQYVDEKWRLYAGDARAAIASMRPTLSEEDRARVEEVRGRANTFSGRFWEVGPQTRVAMIDRIVQDRAFLLSLIDKLAGEG